MISKVLGGYAPLGNRRGNSRSRQARNLGMSCECTRYVVNCTTLPQPAPAASSALPICAKTPLHWLSKSDPGASMPAMKRNSPALTRAMCEYWPSGLPSASTFVILISAIVVARWFRLVARRELRTHRRDQLGAPDRFDVIGIGAGGHAAPDGCVIGDHRNDDHRRGRVGRGRAQRGEHAEAADAGHQQVEQDRVVGIVAGELQRLLAGAGELRLDVQFLG